MITKYKPGIFIRNEDFRELIQQYKVKFPNDKNIDEIYKELFDQDLKSHFIITYSLTGRIGFFSSSSTIDNGKYITYESADINSDFIKLLMDSIDKIVTSFNENIRGI